MESTACPVCTLFLREGISLYDHLDTHPKDQVIEALIRIRDEPATSQQLISIPTSQSTPYYQAPQLPQPCYPVQQYSANSYAYQQMAIMGNNSIPSHMAPVTMVMPPSAPNPSLMQVMYNPYMVQQQNIQLLAPQTSPTPTSSSIHHESQTPIPKNSSILNSESVQTNLSSDSTPFHLHSPLPESRKRQSPSITHSGFVPPVPTPSQIVRTIPTYGEECSEETEEPLVVSHTDEPYKSSSPHSPNGFVQSDSNRTSRVRCVLHYQSAGERNTRSSEISPEIYVIPGTDKETSTHWPNAEVAATVPSITAQFLPSSCPQNILSSGLRELIANNTIKLTPIPIQGISTAPLESEPPMPSISLTIRNKRKENTICSSAGSRQRSESNSSSRSNGSNKKGSNSPRPEQVTVEMSRINLSGPGEKEYYLSQPCSSRDDLDSHDLSIACRENGMSDCEEAEDYHSNVSHTSLKTDVSDDELAVDSKGDMEMLLTREREYEESQRPGSSFTREPSPISVSPSRSTREGSCEPASPAFSQISAGSQHRSRDNDDRLINVDNEDPLEVHSAVNSIMIHMPSHSNHDADQEEYITSDCSFENHKDNVIEEREETPSEAEAAIEEYESRFLKECMSNRSTSKSYFETPSPGATDQVVIYRSNFGGKVDLVEGEQLQAETNMELQYPTQSAMEPEIGVQPKVLKQQIDDLNVSTSYDLLAREGWAVSDGSDNEANDNRRRVSTSEPRWEEVEISPAVTEKKYGKGRALRLYKCALCGETFNCPKERRVHRSTYHSNKTKCSSEIEQAMLSEPLDRDGSDQPTLKTERLVAAKPRSKKQMAKACRVLVVQSATDKFVGVFVKEDGIEPMESDGIKKENQRPEEDAFAKPLDPPLAEAGGSVIKRVTKIPSRISSTRGPYKCVTCSLQFPLRKKLLIHMRQEHKKLKMKNPYICNVCQQVFTNDKLYSEHLRIHPLECKTCCKVFYRRQNLVLHMRRHLGIKPYPCSMCTKSFITKQKLTEHRNVHLGLAPIKCQLCTMSFRRYSNLIQHKNRFHYMIKKKVKDYVCFCGEIYHSKKKLDWHKEIHDKKPKCCKFCSERFVHTASLTRHVRRAHDRRYMPKVGRETENVECSICGHVFLKSSLLVHMRLHSGERPFSCAVCGKSFTTKWNLQQHRWTHMSRSSKPFKCTLCKSAFARESDYTQHMDSHSNKRPYTCNVCGLQFVRKNNCIRHAKEHQAAKTFTCKVCSKSFHRGYYLKDHMMVHSGARPFTCHICGKASSTKSNHNKHVKIHHAREPVNTEA